MIEALILFATLGVFAGLIAGMFGVGGGIITVPVLVACYIQYGFDEAIIITMDGSGDGISCEFCIGKDGDMEILQRFDRPNSLGIFYSMITQYCGFTRDSDEYKLMGLSSYGNRDKFDFSKMKTHEFSLTSAEKAIKTLYEEESEEAICVHLNPNIKN